MAYGLFISLLLCAACTTSPYEKNLYETACAAPDVQLAEAWELLDEARSQTGGCSLNAQGQNECQLLQDEIMRIAFVCPNHVPSLMAVAVLAYEKGEPVKAPAATQRHL